MALVLVEERQALHHPGIQSVAEVTRDLAHDVQAVAQPCELAASGRREDRELAILTSVAVLCYVFAIVSVSSFSVV